VAKTYDVAGGTTKRLTTTEGDVGAQNMVRIVGVGMGVVVRVVVGVVERWVDVDHRVEDEEVWVSDLSSLGDLRSRGAGVIDRLGLALVFSTWALGDDWNSDHSWSRLTITVARIILVVDNVDECLLNALGWLIVVLVVEAVAVDIIGVAWAVRVQGLGHKDIGQASVILGSRCRGNTRREGADRDCSGQELHFDEGVGSKREEETQGTIE
jgi:hypothetical protein